MDTIFALATAQGKAGVSVIRISGARARDAGEAFCENLPVSHKAALRNLTDLQGTLIDQALVLTFEDRKSFTGEPVVEFHLHGSTAIVAWMMELLGGVVGLRLAEPGEFTRRALENGKLDLAQVEGLADLIDAETESQRKQAVRVLAGDLGRTAEIWRSDLIRAASLLEATIDFADEDVPIDVTPEVLVLLERSERAIIKEAEGVKTAERIRAGFEVAIIGAPNVGKSTLLNSIAGRDAAITSEYAGTTRDVIEVKLDLNGLPVTILDTAGLRETEDFVEKIGIDRALDRAEKADLRVFLKSTVEEQFPIEQRSGDIEMLGKADLFVDRTRRSVSGKTGEGVDHLVTAISKTLLDRSASAGIATRERHRQALLSSQKYLSAAKEGLDLGPDHYDLVAEDMRSAIRALNSLIGHVDVENLLDEIFSSFCLGK
ncbi:MAG: tRNA uridine-5-carboxymethylaminomethyl(34) synthesis GTPase MnmE [Planktotalea sp.]|uniref:tRNA uridine-5-carboxymethylaminomethyl(34) synthesis GTPase MnmE n=1 Tax=Planktotalea sp. TaxID=2029877 RepID=UPI00260E8F5B|nr:tRNA uridine-5-carboxymethylaminomethyl(34) synthesis GTPase MnmE [Planktotalea sp.]MDG1077393.1 tRNA uridine-5-carboxymethylaminomethyl(34) synthesis GTPase MnmE [Planktotalea sp.]